MTGAVTRVSELTSAGGEVAPADLRRWLQGFAEVSSQHGAMMRVWTDAGRTHDLLQSRGPRAFDWGRRQLAAALASRAHGHPDAPAVVTRSDAPPAGEERVRTVDTRWPAWYSKNNT